MIIKRGCKLTKLPETQILTKPISGGNTLKTTHRVVTDDIHISVFCYLQPYIYSLHKIWKLTRPCEKVEYIIYGGINCRCQINMIIEWRALVESKSWAWKLKSRLYLRTVSFCEYRIKHWMSKSRSKSHQLLVNCNLHKDVEGKLSQTLSGLYLRVYIR